MSRLDLAERRLADALTRLEQAAAQPGGKRRSPSDEPASAKEHDHLLARIAQLEEELAALSSLSQDVEGRLDGAIGEIRAALAAGG
ncbi:MAG: hypothetical protein ACREFW_10530 [Rhizomicrobium sp.]